MTHSRKRGKVAFNGVRSRSNSYQVHWFNLRRRALACSSSRASLANVMHSLLLRLESAFLHPWHVMAHRKGPLRLNGRWAIIYLTKAMVISSRRTCFQTRAVPRISSTPPSTCSATGRDGASPRVARPRSSVPLRRPSSAAARARARSPPQRRWRTPSCSGAPPRPGSFEETPGRGVP